VTWVVIGAWIAAAVLAVVVLGYCAYEIVWKARRLQRDVAALHGVAGQLAELRQSLADVQERLAASGLR
jgi:hypothetical protein